MLRIGRTTVVFAGILLIVCAARAAVLEPGLEVRAWKDVPVMDTTPIDGSLFDRFHPTRAPNDSTASGTIGYMTLPIHVNPSLGEWFASGGGLSSQIGYLDNFVVEYRGRLLVPASGTYRFSTSSDDGSALWVDPSSSNPSYAEAAVANNYLQGLTLRSSAAIPLAAGYHDLIVRLNEGGGQAGLYVQWDPSGGTNFTDIPGDQFFHEAVPEPSTIALLTSGFLGLVALAWRRKRIA